MLVLPALVAGAAQDGLVAPSLPAAQPDEHNFS